MNEKLVQNKTLKSIYTKQAGKVVKYIGQFQPIGNGEADFEEIVIRKTSNRYGFVAVHCYDYGAGSRIVFSFHARRDLALKSSINNRDQIMRIVEVRHLADKE